MDDRTAPGAPGASDGRPLFEEVLAGRAKLTFGLVGETLGHSYSASLHADLGSAPYALVEVPPERVAEFFAARRFRGLNVTIPHKRAAFAACDETSDAARRLGSVNTLVVRPDGALYGDNTDLAGFAWQLARNGFDVAGRACLVLGDGGAAVAVRAALADAGAAEVLTASRKGPLTFAALRGEGEGAGALAEAAAVRARCALIVNATPVGMYPHAGDALLVDPAAFPALEGVADLVYNPLSTRLVQRAREVGVRAAGGLGMLAAQAAASSELFCASVGACPRIGADEALRRVLARHLAVPLIGMPGCGKSTAGRLVARDLGLPFIDVDELVAARAGMPVPEIFATQGEDAFRALESACTAEALARPAVVACGGGVVTRPENLAALRQNGPVVLLARGLDAAGAGELSTAGRPLSQAAGIERLRRERAPLYRAWADIEVADGRTPRATARAVADAVRAWVGRTAEAGGAC